MVVCPLLNRAAEAGRVPEGDPEADTGQVEKYNLNYASKKLQKEVEAEMTSVLRSFQPPLLDAPLRESRLLSKLLFLQ